jgi:hypothetical protein
MPSRAAELIEQVVGLLRKQPLVTVGEASRILGIKTPNFGRYRDQLTAVPVEGGPDVFFRSEVRALKRRLKR